MSVVEQISERVQEVILDEQRQREETEEKLIALLEDTCMRLERSL